MVSQLSEIGSLAHNECRYILGCLSGTSMDGVDVALFELNGSGRDTKFQFVFGNTYPYPKSVQQALSKLAFNPDTKISEILPLHWLVGEYIAEVVHKSKKIAFDMGVEIDCVASHGQTVFHLDGSNNKRGTLQIGEADVISTLTGLPVISDFRQKDIANKGSGAPLAMYIDELLFQSTEEARVLLNIGGIANITYLPQMNSGGASIAFDTGPGNTLMDAYCKLHQKGSFDVNGDFANSGKVNDTLLTELFTHPYFSKDIPKSTGQESFNLDYVNAILEKTTCQKTEFNSVMATLNMLTAKSISDGIKQVSNDPNTVIYVNGGGIYNETLLTTIRELTGLPVHSVKDLGISPNFKEALIFSVLANEFLAGNGCYCRRVGKNIQLGKLSLP